MKLKLSTAETRVMERLGEAMGRFAQLSDGPRVEMDAFIWAVVQAQEIVVRQAVRRARG